MLVCLFACHARGVWALDLSVPRIGGYQSRGLLGDGTGVTVGIVDSGVDDAHPALFGLDSRGRPRMVAERNFVTAEAGNSGDDQHGHGTGVAGVILGDDTDFAGLAPDARYLNARALDANNRFTTGQWIENAAGWAIDQGADLLNLSVNFDSTSASSSAGGYDLDLMLDWAADAAEHRVLSAVCVGNISQASGGLPAPRSPAGSYNIIAVGQTGPSGYGRLSNDSSYGPTSDGRNKPDLVAPGAGIRTANSRWESADDFRDFNGCSFATPHVTGVLAQMVEYGRSHGLSVHPLVLKSVLMNGAEKIRNRSNEPWEPTAASQVAGRWQITSPLDAQTGAGQVDALAAAVQYQADQRRPGQVPTAGWDLNTAQHSEPGQYAMDVQTGPSSTLTATLTWNRHVARTDRGDPGIDASDQFLLNHTNDALDDLDLTLLLDGQVVAQSISRVDNVEHIRWNVTQSGGYALRVDRRAVPNSGTEETYALAWRVTGFLGDLAENGILDFSDIDLLSGEVRGGQDDPAFDLTDDGDVDQRDRTKWVKELAGTYFGDANLDGLFNSSDLVQVFTVGKYETAEKAGWYAGDWDGSGWFDSGDMVTAFVDGGYEQQAAVKPLTVPEPCGRLLLILAAAGLVFSRRFHVCAPRRCHP